MSEGQSIPHWDGWRERGPLTFLVFSNWEEILVIMPRAEIYDKRDSTWVTPWRSILNLFRDQFPCREMKFVRWLLVFSQAEKCIMALPADAHTRDLSMETKARTQSNDLLGLSRHRMRLFCDYWLVTSDQLQAFTQDSHLLWDSGSTARGSWTRGFHREQEMGQCNASEGSTRLRQNPPKAQREPHVALLGAFQKQCRDKNKHRKTDSNSSLIRDSHLYFLNLGPRNMKLSILIYHGLFSVFNVGDKRRACKC